MKELKQFYTKGINIYESFVAGRQEQERLWQG